MYYGEEIGMEKYKSHAQRRCKRNPIGRTGWPKKRAAMASALRCNGTQATNAGFSKRKFRGFPVPARFQTHNVGTTESKIATPF